MLYSATAERLPTDGVHRLVQCISAHFGIIRCECTILENRITEQIGGRHWHDKACIRESLPEFLQNLIAFSGCGIDRDQIVIMEVDSIRPDFAKQTNQTDPNPNMSE